MVKAPKNEQKEELSGDLTAGTEAGYKFDHFNAEILAEFFTEEAIAEYQKTLDLAALDARIEEVGAVGYKYGPYLAFTTIDGYNQIDLSIRHQQLIAAKLELEPPEPLSANIQDQEQ